MKQAESAAHSSGRRGGESRVLDWPGAGVLQKIPMATSCILALRQPVTRFYRAPVAPGIQIRVIDNSPTLSVRLALNISTAEVVTAQCGRPQHCLCKGRVLGTTGSNHEHASGGDRRSRIWWLGRREGSLRS